MKVLALTLVLFTLVSCTTTGYKSNFQSDFQPVAEFARKLEIKRLKSVICPQVTQTAQISFGITSRQRRTNIMSYGHEVEVGCK